MSSSSHGADKKHRRYDSLKTEVLEESSLNIQATADNSFRRYHSITSPDDHDVLPAADVICVPDNLVFENIKLAVYAKYIYGSKCILDSILACVCIPFWPCTVYTFCKDKHGMKLASDLIVYYVEKWNVHSSGANHIQKHKIPAADFLPCTCTGDVGEELHEQQHHRMLALQIVNETLRKEADNPLLDENTLHKLCTVNPSRLVPYWKECNESTGDFARFLNSHMFEFGGSAVQDPLSLARARGPAPDIVK